MKLFNRKNTNGKHLNEKTSKNSPRKKAKPYRRFFRPSLEQLERRDLLTAVTSDFQLMNDSGMIASDLITNDPTVTAEVSWSSPDTMYATVEFDHDGDGQMEDFADVFISGESFYYDPLAVDAALENWEGLLTLKYRTVAHEIDGDVVGQWEEFTFTLDRVAPNVTDMGAMPDQVFATPPTEMTVTFNEIIDATSGVFPNIFVEEAATGLQPEQMVEMINDTQAIITFGPGGLSSDSYITWVSDVTDVAGNQMLFAESVSWLVEDPDPIVEEPNLAPEIINFTGSQGPTVWTFEGWVIDEYPQGLVVIFGGVLAGHTATVDADGYFSFSIILDDPFGVATAETTDIEGLSSNVANWFV